MSKFQQKYFNELKYLSTIRSINIFRWETNYTEIYLYKKLLKIFFYKENLYKNFWTPNGVSLSIQKGKLITVSKDYF